MSSAGTGTSSKFLINFITSLCATDTSFSDAMPLLLKLLPALLPVALLAALCAAMCACISASALLSAAAILSGLPRPASTPLWLPFPSAAAAAA
jgi:hypothetical protein